MNKKRLIGAALAASIGLTAVFSGCSLVSSNSLADMEQIVATVNIADAEGLRESDRKLIDEYKGAVGSTDILKRNLIASYINVGSSYYDSLGSNAAVFNMLMDGLTESAVLTQYATMYLLQLKAENEGKTSAQIISEYEANTTYAGKLEYILGADSADVMIAKYSLYSALNAAIDSYELQIINNDDEPEGTETRTTPTGVDSEKEDYYPVKKDASGNPVTNASGVGELDYNVYTGYSGTDNEGNAYDYCLTASGAYQDDKLDGTTRSTRIRAYNKFMSRLESNGLIDSEKEDMRNVLALQYMGDEYAGQLENRIVNKYYKEYEKAQEAEFTDDGRYDYLNKVYEALRDEQQESNKTADSFKTAMDNMSDTSFVLYSRDTNGDGVYGYVYNILLPFSTVQSAKLTELQGDVNNKNTDGSYNPAYYNKRNELLKSIVTTDQRAAWFNGETVYAFDATDKVENFYGKDAGRNWLFFENNLINNQRYEALSKYAGLYSYNGTAVEYGEGKDKGYHLVPNELNIDSMLGEFRNYLNYVLGGEKVTFTDGYNPDDYDPSANTANPSFYKTYTADDTFYSNVDDKEINYSNFIYTKGKVELTQTDKSFAFATGRTKAADGEWINGEADDAYKALSAVNELQYAYTTDTGILSRYAGYTVTLGDTTGFIKEFETAAHEVLERGAGAFNVCAGDYGWHILYATYTFNAEGGEEFTPQWAENVGKEGTFENLFYEMVKSNDISNISSTRRTQIIKQFKEKAVVTYQSRYQDLLDLG